MRKFAIYLFSILLLSTVIAKAAPSVIGRGYTSPKFIEGEKTEKIELEGKERSASEKLKNNEFIHPNNPHRFANTSRPFLFIDIVDIVPSSYFELPERPPKKK